MSINTQTASFERSSNPFTALRLTPTSNTCIRCSHTLYLPPPVEVFISAHPYLVPFSINRSQPRCAQCDMVNAERAVVSVKFPEPTLEDPVAEINNYIVRVEKQIADGIMQEQLSLALEFAKKEKNKREKDREVGIRKSWEPFWGVWGLPKERGS